MAQARKAAKAQANGKSHDFDIVAECYDLARECIETVLDAIEDVKLRAEMRELLKDTASAVVYKSSKDKGHTAGMPQKLWAAAVRGIPTDKVIDALQKTLADKRAEREEAKAAAGAKDNDKPSVRDRVAARKAQVRKATKKVTVKRSR